jgi:hypothetical protein
LRVTVLVPNRLQIAFDIRKHTGLFPFLSPQARLFRAVVCDESSQCLRNDSLRR